MVWTILMYVCLAAGIVLLGFGIYGFVYTPSSPSEVLNTEVDGSNKYNCDPNEAGAKNATVTCDSDNDCAIKCQQSDAKCIPKSVKNIQTNKMERGDVCMVSIKTPTSACNANYGGELVLQPSADGNSMVWGCQCNYPDYVSENPSPGKDFCQLLPNVCKNGKFVWNAESEAPEDATCVCDDKNYKMVKDFNGVPTCIENSKLGAAAVWNSKDKDYESAPKASGAYPCLGNNSFC